MTPDNHQEWMRRLRVGDKVCNCDFKHVKITSIQDDMSVWRPWLYRWIVFNDWMPTPLLILIDVPWAWACRKLGAMVLIDRELTLEDGNVCSAEHCCDPVEHEWEHILKGEYKEKM
jgi:hypothetical protein